MTTTKDENIARWICRPLSVEMIAGGMLLCAGAFLCSCDLLGEDASFDVPSERLVSMTAVFEETHESGRPVHRLVVADVENPSNHEVLSAAGRDVGRSCFGPDKRRLLFEDNSGSNVGSRAPVKLLDLETRKVRDLDATGTLKGCVWRADGSGFYFAAAGGAGLRISAFYDLESGETRSFAQKESQGKAMRGSIPYSRKGRDSILVRADSLVRRENGGFKNVGGGFYFVDAETEKYLTQIENERLEGAITPAYNGKQSLVAFQGGSRVTVSDLEGSFFETYGVATQKVYHIVRWGPENTVLAERRPQSSFDPEKYRVMGVNIETGGIREFVEPKVIDGAVGLRAPDY